LGLLHEPVPGPELSGKVLVEQERKGGRWLDVSSCSPLLLTTHSIPAWEKGELLRAACGAG